jgi:hypothetical protein
VFGPDSPNLAKLFKTEFALCDVLGTLLLYEIVTVSLGTIISENSVPFNIVINSVIGIADDASVLLFGIDVDESVIAISICPTVKSILDDDFIKTSVIVVGAVKAVKSYVSVMYALLDNSATLFVSVDVPDDDVEYKTLYVLGGESVPLIFYKYLIDFY